MSGVKGKKKGASFVIDCTKLVEDKIMDIVSLEKFLQDRIKVGDKAGALGDSITVTRDKSKIIVTSDSNFSKRYSLRHAPLLAHFMKGYFEGHILENGWPQLLKLKDWPTPSASEEFLLYQRPEFISKLPLLQYIHSKWGLAFFNVVAKLPHYSLRNDVGPKIYISYGISDELRRGDSVTNLHFNMRDMFHRRDELLRLWLLGELRHKVLHHDGTGGSAGNSGGDGEALLLAVDLDGPVAGLRAEDDASAGAEGSAVGPRTSLRVRVEAVPRCLFWRSVPRRLFEDIFLLCRGELLCVWN
ncbi:60S ribosomal protein L22-2 [Glycine soja]|uniref:60S ribosomal protein L22-2 n=1 Tax=Glycine soja TaxID=3848 RepID=A0A0B2QGN2_GLYSO|nr:60S ribosomal protein L22-2 [Glycine soja]